MSFQHAQPVNTPYTVSIGSLKAEYRLAFFLAVNVCLALLMHAFPAVSTVHAILTLSIGILLAALTKRLEHIAYVGTYIAGSEVLWRMTKAQVFWEYGKYAVIAVFLVTIVRVRFFKGPFLPLIYFALLLPSSLFLSETQGWEDVRQNLSFYLSGPLALTVSAFFFWRLSLSQQQLLGLFLAFIGPVVGIAAIAAMNILGADKIYFGHSSNIAASGGFGPNQVSSVLGLGALLAFFYVVNKEIKPRIKVIICGVIIFLGAQSALTFSRNGLINSIASVTVASLYLIKNKQTRLKFILGIGILFVAANFFVLPQLDELTKGALTSRFSQTKVTGRDKLALSELQVWQDNFLLGAGPGMAESSRHESIRSRSKLNVASHTEYTRLLAEHGLLGLAAMVVLLIMGVRNLQRVKLPENKAIIAAMIVWALLYMGGNGMRLVAPSLIIGMTFINFLKDQSEQAIHYSKLARR